MLKSTLGAIGATALIAVAAPAAFAAPPYLVDVGGDTSNTDHTFEAKNKKAAPYSPGVLLAITGAGGVVILGCVNSEAEGIIHGGHNTTGLIAEITNTIWTGCIGPSNLPLSVYPTHNWGIETNDTVSNAATDEIDGDIIDVVATVKSKFPGIPEGSLCQFDITGSITVGFNEALVTKPGPPAYEVQQLIVDGTGLQLSNVVNCFGAFADGDPVLLQTEYNIDTIDDNPVTSSNQINVKPMP